MYFFPSWGIIFVLSYSLSPTHPLVTYSMAKTLLGVTDWQPANVIVAWMASGRKDAGYYNDR